jgi:hypothetical protein
LDEHLVIFDTISIKESVNVDPLESSEGTQKLAVVETSSGTDAIVSRSSHHGGVEDGLGLVSIVVVLEVLPDPKRASIIRSMVISNYEFFAYSVVSIDGLL